MRTTRSRRAWLAAAGIFLTTAGWLPAHGATSGTFQPVGMMVKARGDATVTRLRDGSVLVTGGYADTGALASAERFDPTTNQFAAVGRMSAPRMLHAAVRLQDGRVLV